MPDSRFFKSKGPFSVYDIAEHAGCELIGEPTTMISDIATLRAAQVGHLSFLNDSFLEQPRYKEEFKACKASACIVAEQHIPMAPEGMVLLVSDNAHDAYARVASKFYPAMYRSRTGIASNTHIANTAHLGVGCVVEEFVYIGEDVDIGPGSYISAHSYIGDGVKIGANAKIYPSVTVMYAMLGDNVIIHPGARIGQDGFGYAVSKAGITKVPQLGRVIIGNNVEVGANTCIDRGAIEDTVIGDNCKFDNMVQVGHNVRVGNHCLIVAQSGIAGSAELHDGVMLGGQSGINGHIDIGAGAKIAARSGVVSNVKAGETVGGFPAIPIREWHRQTVTLKNMTKKNHDQ
jgi:UDP-3-O-[3-hydroxymyristoyl] glucosamine N-acyltransferase